MIEKFKIFIFALVCFTCLPLLAAQEAVVKTDYAIIYADPELEAPIGKVRRGKTIMVGEVKRRQDTILPVSVSGRIAWIKVEDITLKSDLNFDRFQEQFTEHDVDANLETALDRLSKHNYLIFNYGLTTLSDEWPDFTESVGSNVQSNSMDQFRLYFEHRPPFEKYNWGLGLSYVKTPAHEGQAQYQALFLEFNLSRLFLRTRFLSIEATGGLLLSGSSEMAINTTEVFFHDKGPAWGYRAGLSTKVFPYSRYGIYGGIHYEWINTSNFGDIESRDGRIFNLNNLSGISVLVGLSYQL